MLIINRTRIPQNHKEYLFFLQNAQILRQYAKFIKMHYKRLVLKIHLDLGGNLKYGMSSQEQSRILGGVQHIYQNICFKFRKPVILPLQSIFKPSSKTAQMKKILLIRKAIADGVN